MQLSFIALNQIGRRATPEVAVLTLQAYDERESAAYQLHHTVVLPFGVHHIIS